jgi:transposase
MNYTHYIGIDVSKLWLDFTAVKENEVLFHLQTDNTLAGIQSFIKRLKQEKDFNFKSTIFCMEHTGIYNNHLLTYLDKKNANVCLESGTQIKRSSGLKRGKNDKIDARAIALYAYKNREELKLWKPKREVITELRHLTTLRNRLVGIIKQIKTPLKEAGEFVTKRIKNSSEKLCKQTLKSVEKDLKNIEKEIRMIIDSDPELNRIFNIIISVSGIGPVTASEMIITTNEFKDISCPKKFACYSGVAPFEHQSGTSIRGKTRVSHMGNKAMKTLLHMSALVAIRFNNEIKNYYERKVAEGKNKMLVLNAVRNKLIERIFACVKQNRLFINNYQYTLV